MPFASPAAPPRGPGPSRLYDIFGFAPGDVVPDQRPGPVAPAPRGPRRPSQQVLEDALETGRPHSVWHRLVNAQGSTRQVVTLCAGDFAEDGDAGGRERLPGRPHRARASYDGPRGRRGDGADVAEPTGDRAGQGSADGAPTVSTPTTPSCCCGATPSRSTSSCATWPAPSSRPAARQPAARLPGALGRAGRGTARRRCADRRAAGRAPEGSHAACASTHSTNGRAGPPVVADPVEQLRRCGSPARSRRTSRASSTCGAAGRCAGGRRRTRAAWSSASRRRAPSPAFSSRSTIRAQLPAARGRRRSRRGCAASRGEPAS